MSDYYKKTGYNTYQLETQWLNLTMGGHDMFCFCDKPWMHMLQAVLQRQNFFELDNKQARIIQRCLTTMATEDASSNQGTAETTGKNTKEEDGLDLEPGELERLFANEDTDG